MTDKTEGLEVVAWQHVFADGRIVSYSEDQAGFPARDDALKVEPLVTLASAQAAVAAKQYNVDTWYERFVESEKRITDLERVNQELLKCLKWYVDEDDVDNRESNKFWLEGKARAEAAIAAAEKEAK